MPRAARPAPGLRLLLAGAALLALAAAAAALAVAGSPARLAEGVRVAGVDVGGMTPRAAEALLERQGAALAGVPVTFVAADERVRLTPAQLGIQVDWQTGVETARREGDGLAPVRALRRLQTRVFGADVAPPVGVSDRALRYSVERLAASVRRPPREAAIVLRGLRPELVPARAGRELDAAAAESAIVRALASLGPRAPVFLPVRVDRPEVEAAALRPALAQVRTAVSAPVRLTLGRTRWRLPRWRVAGLLALPAEGTRTVRIGGARADAFFARFRRAVERPARSATFVPRPDGSVSVAPAVTGLRLDRGATEARLLAAALSARARTAAVAVRGVAPGLTTREARSLGITRVLASYSTAYAGSADRVHNLRLAVWLVDGAIVPRGATFSLNARMGERTLARGFRPAPVIVGGKYEQGVGGGVSQVATTVFNAAWEAGLPIAERVAHSLYIDRYPLGRDATVNYPNLDLEFVNDTRGAIVVRAFAGDLGIGVSLLGRPTGRRVFSDAGPLVVTAAAPVRAIRDPSLAPGTAIVEEEGAPARSVVVRRTVLDARGRVLRAETWRSDYRAETRLVRLGPKPKPKPEPEARPRREPEDEERKDEAAEPEETRSAPTTTEPDPAATTPRR